MCIIQSTKTALLRIEFFPAPLLCQVTLFDPILAWNMVVMLLRKSTKEDVPMVLNKSVFL